MSNKSGMKKCKNLEKSTRHANHYKAVRLHRIVNARNNHLKNALRSCGKVFADKLREYYSRHPTIDVRQRMGNHLGME